ncbi:hypothetical protein BAUCODRAFT_271510 [Baudoinia panamericana UAMH 10762]|uniref:BTB domain-containing protein n=1 Tax=Baudoinia panamericana (strain UAMH 10762) TaxID=717646 RepID=M2MNK6_BAUPA|nr:uncharacterized protein BAUCODRAFT_271510 [Baudoinia panamericana UAMH 10762]EMC93028.1 hypothetical protein BAUCODRAFT_271510 [Baudoinia panamericana UAMH 10762]
MNTVPIAVGLEAIKSVVSKNLLCACSPLFAAATSERWAGRLDKIVRLAEDDLDISAIYLQTLYTNDFVVLERPDDNISLHGDEHRSYLFRTYVIADNLGDVKSSNPVIGEIVRLLKLTSCWNPKSAGVFAKHTIEPADKRTAGVSVLCPVIVDHFRIHVSGRKFKQLAKSALLQQVFVDLAFTGLMTYAPTGFQEAEARSWHM